jgi:hypothetical protein
VDRAAAQAGSSVLAGDDDRIDFPVPGLRVQGEPRDAAAAAVSDVWGQRLGTAGGLGSRKEGAGVAAGVARMSKGPAGAPATPRSGWGSDHEGGIRSAQHGGCRETRTRLRLS